MFSLICGRLKEIDMKDDYIRDVGRLHLIKLDYIRAWDDKF